MRAIQMTEFGGPEVLKLAELPTPEPGPGRGADQGHPRGAELRRHPHRAPTPTCTRPRCRSSPAARWRASREDTGERVVALVGSGGYAEYAIAPKEHIFPIPDGRRRRHGAGADHPGHDRLAPVPHLPPGWPRARAWSCTRAAGGVGSLAVQLGHALGAGRVIATASSEEKRELALELGADVAVDPTAEGLTERLTRGQRGHARSTSSSRCPAARSSTPPTRRSRPSDGSSSYGIATAKPTRSRTGSLLRHSRAVVGFYLFHCLERPGMFAEALDDLFARAARRRAARRSSGTPTRWSRPPQAQIDLRARRTTGKLLLDPIRLISHAYAS